MMIRVSRDTIDALGGPAALEVRVVAFQQKLAQHPFTVDQPAPVEDDLVERIARSGGMAEVEIVNSAEATLGLPIGGPLDALKALALLRVDEQAERVRQLYITPGAGQALEYQATEAEARRWQQGETLDGYPFLKAEADAVEDASGQRPADAVVVASVLANADAWAAAGAAIKRIRRGRKLEIEAAQGEAVILAILDMPWSIAP